MLGRLARGLAAAAFGGTCFLCRGAAGGVLCEACEADLPRLAGPRCARCALAAPEGAAQCGRCLARPPAYDATIAALAYEFPADVLVQALKFRGELALAPLLGGLLARALPPGTRADVLLPVPLSGARLRSRGFNPAMELARPLAAATGARLEPRLAGRVRDTAPQMELAYAARAANVRGAFGCARDLEGAEVAVVDDVMTTGATLEELAATLKRAGASRVVNWVLARTPPPADA